MYEPSPGLGWSLGKLLHEFQSGLNKFSGPQLISEGEQLGGASSSSSDKLFSGGNLSKLLLPSQSTTTATEQPGRASLPIVADDLEAPVGAEVGGAGKLLLDGKAAAWAGG